MLQLDHLILRVRDAKTSIRFYQRILGLHHDGASAPFEVLRIDAGCTIDLLQEPPRESGHLAFSLERSAFERVRERLLAAGIPFGGGPFLRNGGTALQYGARGWADALYFFDPDRHNIEVRTYV